ncbi:MAG: ankyrin repeat domain-containing protein [Hyphomicrobiaceae bacterium]|nr:MAG: ankyrin repeat domain-containing protein [Hyphomicrobiaceae bacterium]
MAHGANEELIESAKKGDLAGIEKALAAGADVNAKADYDDTALNYAAENGHKEVVARLIAGGADIENKGGADKTPIKNAAFAGNIGIVRLLLEKGARINNDLLDSVALKVSIFRENAELGMVRPEGVAAWEQFLAELVAAHGRQQAQ